MKKRTEKQRLRKADKDVACVKKYCHTRSIEFFVLYHALSTVDIMKNLYNKNKSPVELVVA
jgi:hypothetical protein